MLSAQCTLPGCFEIITGNDLFASDPNEKRALEWQHFKQRFLEHLAARHMDVMMALTTQSMDYQLQLASKFAKSSDPNFEIAQHEGARIHYWCLMATLHAEKIRNFDIGKPRTGQKGPNGGQVVTT